ncbi:hypothetical protein EMCRGX_G014394 [Ephydatia muelleri]
MAALELKNSVWLDRPKYEAAETHYHEVIAKRHSGLRIEGSPAPVTNISSELEKACDAIKQTLKTQTPASSTADVEGRVSKLEKENAELKAAVKALETRIAALEGKKQEQAVKTPEAPKQAPPPKQETAKQAADDDNFDLFGSEDEASENMGETAAAQELRQKRLDDYAKKKATKPALVPKSTIILEVKPWDDETNMDEIEEKVRSIHADGLVWGWSKRVPHCYGIFKLQINCVVEDDKSVDIIAFNKI